MKKDSLLLRILMLMVFSLMSHKSTTAQEFSNGRDILGIGNGNGVLSLALSPDGNTIATGSRDQAVKLWDTKLAISTGGLVKTLGPVTCVAFSPDGNIVASAHVQNTLCLWERVSGKVLHTVEIFEVSTLAFSPDGKWIATGSSGSNGASKIKIWSAVSAKYVNDFGDPVLTNSIKFSPDGKLIACGSWGGTTKVFNIESKKCVAEFHQSEKFHPTIEFAPNGIFLAIGNFSNIKLLDLEKNITTSMNDPRLCGVQSLAIDPKGRFLLSADFKRLILWDLSTRKVIKVLFEDEKQGGSHVAISGNGKVVALCTNDFAGADQRIIVWDLVGPSK